jgi:hypothetical protein
MTKCCIFLPTSRKSYHHKGDESNNLFIFSAPNYLSNNLLYESVNIFVMNMSVYMHTKGCPKYHKSWETKVVMITVPQDSTLTKCPTA